MSCNTSTPPARRNGGGERASTKREYDAPHHKQRPQEYQDTSFQQAVNDSPYVPSCHLILVRISPNALRVRTSFPFSTKRQRHGGHAEGSSIAEVLCTHLVITRRGSTKAVAVLPSQHTNLQEIYTRGHAPCDSHRHKMPGHVLVHELDHPPLDGRIDTTTLCSGGM